MPAHRKKPVPSVRMVELLAAEKRRLLDEAGDVTRDDFERAWQRAWGQLVAEHVWPHNTEHRRQWWATLLAAKAEARAAFLDMPTSFAQLIKGLAVACSRFEIEMTSDQLPNVILGAVGEGYELTSEDERRAAWLSWEEAREEVLVC